MMFMSILSVFFVIHLAYAAPLMTLSGANVAVKTAGVVHSLVTFYAPWCGHCKKLMPELESLTEICKTTDSGCEDVLFALVDSTKEENFEAIKTYGISGFPTVVYFMNGQASREYFGKRIVSSMVLWLKQRITGVDETTPSQEEVLSSWNQHWDSETKRFYYHNYLTKISQWEKPEGFTNPPKPNTPSENKKPDKDSHTLPNLVSESDTSNDTLPQVVAFSAKKTKKVLSGKLKLEGMKNFVVLCHGKGKKSEDDNLVDAFWDIANLFKSNGKRQHHKIGFIDVDVERSPDKVIIADAIGIDLDKTPAVISVVDHTKGNPIVFFVPENVKDEKMLLNFLNEYVSGVLPRSKGSLLIEETHKFGDSIKSGYIVENNPEKTSSAVVIDVTGDTFSTIVMKQGRDVLLEIYSPSCKHCKSFTPHYNSLAEKLFDGHIDTVLVAKMDGTQNEVYGLVYTEYPTLFLFPAFNKENPIKYKGEISAGAMLDWVHSKAGMIFTKPL